MLTLYKIFFNNITPEGLVFDLLNVGITEQNELYGHYIILLLLALVWIAASYFLGSLNFSIIISKLAFHDDVRKHGSANAGSTNMQRTYGNKAGAMTLFCDMAKGLVAVLIARVLFGENAAYFSGLMCVIGHCFPCYFKFKGGKGVATAAAVILALNPLVFAALVLIFALLVLCTKYISLGSVISAMLFPVFLNRYGVILQNAGLEGEFGTTFAMAVSSILIAAIIVARHSSNIKKLFEGKENKISFKGKGKKSDKYAKKEQKVSLHNIDKDD